MILTIIKSSICNKARLNNLLKFMNTTITKLNNTQIEIKFYLIIRMNEYFNLRLKLMLPKPVLAKHES
jgi:hypothetical protein